MGQLLGPITQPNVLSRYLNLAVALEAVLNSTIHANEKLLCGTVLAKIVATGKYRAYAEGTVKTGGEFATNAATFTLENPANVDLMKHFRIGDVITISNGSALGTILTYDPVTGIGTLSGNSTTAAAAGLKIIISVAVASIAKADVRILKSETLVESADVPVAGYNEGYFNTAMVLGATAAAITAMGAKAVSTTEFRLV